MLASSAGSAIDHALGEDGLALVAVVVRDGVRSEHITGVSVRVLLLLGTVATVS